MRYAVFQRDRGRCAQCGLDTAGLAAAISYVQELSKEHRSANGFRRAAALTHQDFRDFREVLGDAAGRWPNDLWDADHIKAVVEGGGECSIDNIRTLCVPCHKAATRDLAGRRARDRRLNRPLPLFDAVGM